MSSAEERIMHGDCEDINKCSNQGAPEPVTEAVEAEGRVPELGEGMGGRPRWTGPFPQLTLLRTR